MHQPESRQCDGARSCCVNRASVRAAATDPLRLRLVRGLRRTCCWPRSPCVAMHIPAPPYRHSLCALCRSDLRLRDNPALAAATKQSAAVLPVYVFDREAFGRTDAGHQKASPASVRFLLQSVEALRVALRSRGSDLIVRHGTLGEELRSLAAQVGASTVHCRGAPGAAAPLAARRSAQAYA